MAKSRKKKAAQTEEQRNFKAWLLQKIEVDRKIAKFRKLHAKGKVEGLGKVYKRAPKDCTCGRGEKVLVGKFGVRCMRVHKVGGRKRFIYSKTSPKCNK